jgi:hypothetical protein
MKNKIGRVFNRGSCRGKIKIKKKKRCCCRLRNLLRYNGVDKKQRQREEDDVEARNDKKHQYLPLNTAFITRTLQAKKTVFK